MAERTDEQYPFLEHRRLLFATAYRMLETVTDVLQDARLKWNDTDWSPVRHPKAYLVRTVTGGMQGIGCASEPDPRRSASGSATACRSRRGQWRLCVPSLSKNSPSNRPLPPGVCSGRRCGRVRSVYGSSKSRPTGETRQALGRTRLRIPGAAGPNAMT